MQERYCEALVAEASSHRDAPMASSLFIGGGTPTVLDAEMLGETLARIQDALPTALGAEITVEANPESVTEHGMRALAAAGVNRVSIGVQSFAPHVLRALGRTHSAEQAANAVASARAASIANVSVDLIYGGPGESMQYWTESLRQALELSPDHISAYALTIEERTPFGKAVARGSMQEPEQDDLAAKYEIAVDMLEDAGYGHYEISNWARPGFESRHNLIYWTQGEYVGLGVGAHSHRDGVRWWNTRELTRYIGDPTGARAGEERLSGSDRAEEWLSLRMRLCEGIGLDEAAARLGRDLRDAAEACEAGGLITLDGDRLRLTARGMLLENEVTLRLLSA
jgi:oxygen-independent coproporphyrinogen-3 oxidase